MTTVVWVAPGVAAADVVAELDGAASATASSAAAVMINVFLISVLQPWG